LFIRLGSASDKTADSNKEILAAFRSAFPLESKRKTEKSLQTSPSGPGGAHFLEFECLAKERTLIIHLNALSFPNPFLAFPQSRKRNV